MSGHASPLFAGVATRTAEVNGRERVVALAASSEQPGGALCDAEGIDSARVLEWLGGLPEAFPGRRLVVFGGRYDVTHWLAGVPRGTLRALWARGDARWHRSAAADSFDRYSLHMIDGHSFGVWREGWPSRVKVTDVAPLFPGLTLRDACDAWGVPEGGEDGLADEMMGRCEALAALMQRVAAKGREVGLRPPVWGAPGALAGALLRKHKAGAHLEPSKRIEVREAALTAYYGGRVDMLQQGECARVLALDMRSAYPWALASAPSMVGSWRKSKVYVESEGFALWKARFKAPKLRALTPLPVRTPERVTYPAEGAGWWHACELAAAIRSGADVDVSEGFVFTPAPGEPAEPFAWLRELYALRVELRDAGDDGEQLVKLALNAIYGKLAQSRGKARYQCFELAGWVTARVRAAMLDVAMIAPAEVISIHTDGLLFDTAREPTSGPLITVGEGLGEWEAHRADNLLIVQPGVYTYDEPGVGVAVARRGADRQRGVPDKGLSWERVAEEWRECGTAGRVRLSQRMAHGIGTCATRRRWGTLGQWVTETRTVSFAATSRFPSSRWSGGLQAMLPVAWAGPAIPYEPADGPDPDELLRREQPAE